MTHPFVTIKLGEDIDDFVVRTKSKTDQIIRDYTAVASNNFKGVSVLTEQGDQRNTYDILRDIAAVYKEIQETDEKLHTNRAGALVEELAGKNRSNIASSILLNGDVLEQVKEAAENDYAGSAQQELDKYLESIDGKLAKLQNRLQELAAISIDSDWIKIFLDGATGLVGAFTTLLDKGGAFKILLSGIAGTVGQIFGLGVLNFGKDGKSNGLFSGLKDFFKKPKAQNYMGWFSENEDTLLNIDPSDLDGLNDFISKTADADDILKKFLLDVNQSDKSFAGFASWLLKSSNGLSSFQKVAMAAGGVLKNVLGAGLNMLAMYAISKGVEFLITQVYNWINASKIAIEEGQKAQEKITEIMETIKEETNAIDDISIKIGIEEPEKKEIDEKIDKIAEEYVKLSAGVNDSNENQSLTNDEYDRYLTITDKIAKQYPSLIKGYDSQDHAILNLGDTVDEVTEKLNLMHEASLNIANIEIGENLEKAFEGFQTQINEYEKKLDKLRKRRKELIDSDNVGPFVGTSMEISKDFYEENLKSIFENANLESYVINQGENVVLWFYKGLADKMSSDSEFADSVNSILLTNVDVSEYAKEAQRISKELAKTDSEISSTTAKQADEYNKMAQSIKSYLDTSVSFKKVNSDIQEAVFGNLNSEEFLKGAAAEEYQGEDGFEDFVYDAIITPLSKLSEEAQGELSKMFELDPTQMNLQDYQNQVKTIMQSIFGDQADDFTQLFGLEDRINGYRDKLKTVLAQLSERFGSELTDEEKMKIITSWNIADVEKAYALLGDESIRSYNAYKKKVEEETELPKNDTTFSSLLKDDSDQGLKKTIDNFKALNTEIQGYIDSINKGESVNIADIVGAHPEQLMKYSDSLDHLLEGLLEMRGDEAKKFAENYSKIVKDGLGREPSAEEIELASQYFNNIIGEVKIDDSSIEDVMQKIRASIIGQFKGQDVMGQIAQAQYADQVVSQLQALIDADSTGKTGEIIARLSLETDSATWNFETWKEKIEQMRIILQPTWDEQRLANLESELAGLNTGKTVVTNRISNAQNRGQSAEASDYQEVINYNKQISKTNNTLIDEYNNKLTKLGNITKDNIDIANGYKDKIAQLTQEQQTLNDETLQYVEMLNGGLELEGLTRQLNALKRQQSQLEIYRNQKTADREYYSKNDLTDLRNNAEQQISVIEQQNEYLLQQRQIVGDNATEYNKINDQLIENMKTIQELSATVEDYDKSIAHHYSLQAEGLLEGVNAVINQSLTDSIDQDSMDALISSFSELKEISSNIDLSSMFYRSAQGIKVNFRELERYINLQRKISSTGILAQMSKLNAQLRTQQNIYKTLSKQVDIDGTTKRNAAKQNLENIRSEIKAIGLEVQAYAKAQNAIEESMSGFNKWQAALQTPNGRSKYDTIQNELANLEKMRDAGLIGTDDFKTAIEMLTQEDRNTARAFEDIYPWLTEYFRPDGMGLLNFMEDLTDLGIAEDNAGVFTFKTTDLEEISQAIGTLWGGPQAAPDEEIIQTFLEALKDYGFEVVSVLNEVDATAQQIETVQELAQKIVKRAEGEVKGVSDITMQESQEDIDKLIERYRNLDEMAQQYANEPLITEESYNADIAGINDLLAYANQNMFDPKIMTYFYDEAKKMADRLGMEITENADGTFSLVQASYEDTLGKMEEATAQRLTDLRNRPKLSLQDLIDAGYDVGQVDNDNIDSLVTLYSHTFSNEDASRAITLTPILPNGEILSPQELEDYANQILEGGLDIKGLVLGDYSADDGWSNPLDKAIQLGEVLHQVSDVYEHMDEEDEQLLNSLRGYSAEFLKTIDMTKDYSLLPDVSQDAKDAQAAIIAIGDRLGYSKEKAMELGTAIIDSFDKFGLTANNFDAEYVVKTRLEDISDDPDKIDFWKDLISKGDDETLAKEFNLDINTYDGEQKVEDLKQHILGLDSSEFSMTVKLDQEQVNELLESLNNISLKVGVDKDAFTNSTQEAIDNAADKISLSKIQEKLQNMGMSEEKVSRALETYRSDPRVVDDIQQPEVKEIEVAFKVNEEISNQNISGMLTSLQEYADKNGVEIKITATKDGVETVVDEAYEYRNGDVISITITGEESESFTDVMTKTNKTIAMINGKHELVVAADGTQLDSLNTKLDDTQSNVAEDGSFKGANTDEAEANLDALNGSIDETQENAEEETDVNLDTEEAVNKLDELETKQNTIQEKASEGSKFNVTISGDDVEQLSSAVNEISQYENIDIIINGVATTAEEAINYIKDNDGEEIAFILSANDQDAVDVLNTFCEETVPGKFPKVKVGGNIDPLNATVKGGVQQIEANPAALQAVDANMDPFNNTLQIQQNNMNANPLRQPVIYDEPIGPMPIQQSPVQAQSAYDNSLRNSIIYYKAHGTLNAYAKGTDVKNGRLTKDENALVNEIGQESRITRDGRWELLPPGMHVEHLKRGEIILNAEQTEDLIKHNAAHGVGKIVGGQSAFASGTMHEGMRSFATASASGFFNIMPEGTHDFFQKLADGVDDLNDYNDSARDAGDAARDVGDAADNVGDAFDDLVDQVQYSFQSIDLVQRRLQYFSNQTKKIADQITQYVDTATRRQLIGNEINAISQELWANSKAATTYTEEAIKEAFDHKYYATDKNAEKNLQYALADYQNAMNAMGSDRDNDYYRWLQGEVNNLEHQLKVVQNTQLEYSVNLAEAINLEDLRNGDFRIDQIDTSTDYGKALYDAAQQYMQLTDNAINAANQIQTLSNQLRSLYSDMINLPFEDLEKELSKLENTMQSINSFMSTMSMGGSAIDKLKETITGIFGKQQVSKLFGNFSKTYDLLNYQVEKNVLNMSAKVNENAAAYEQSKINYNDLSGRSGAANRKLESAKKSFSGLMLPSYVFDALNNGEFLDASRFGVYADKIAHYNQCLAEANALSSAATEAQEKMNEQFEKASQSAAEYAQTLVQSVFDKMENIDNFYKSLTEWHGTLANSLAVNRDVVIKTGDYLKKGTQIAGSYISEMNQYKLQADNLRREGVLLRDELNVALTQGRIKYGDENYRKAMTQIIEVENEYVNARSKVRDLNEEFANIPVKEAEEKLNKIAKKYQALTQIGNSVGTRGQQSMYTQLATGSAMVNYDVAWENFGTTKSKSLLTASREAQKNAGLYNTSETFVGANRYLEADLERMKEETKVSNETMIKLTTQMNQAQKDYDVYQKRVDSFAGRYMGAITGIQDNPALRQAGIDAVNNRTKIDTSTLRGDLNSWVYSYINQWNAYIENLETKAGQLKVTSELLDQETANNQQKIGELAAAMAELYPKEFENAGNYYKSLYENNEKLASTYEKVRETINELGRSMDEHGNLVTDTATLSQNYQSQIDNINKSYNNMSKSMEVQSKLLADIGAALGEDSEEYRTAQNELYDLQNRMNDTIITMDKLRDESREVLYFKPIEEYIEKINKLRDNLDELVGMFSEDMYFTDDGEYTQFGFISAEAAMSGYTRSLQAINKIQEEFNINEERWMNDSTYSAEEYLEKREQITDSMRKELQDANGYRTKIISIYTSRYKQEVSYLQELIKARQEALQKQKEMYDYDRQLKQKTKDIQLIQQQIRALNGLTDAESKAQKARLEAQLADSQDDLDETVKQHVYDMRIEGLSELSNELNENYDKLVKDLKINTDTVVSTINDLSTGLGSYLTATNAGINTWLQTFSPTLNSAMLGVEALQHENTDAIPDKEQLNAAAERMVHYYDNLSATEAERVGTITGAVQQETEKVASAIRDYTANKAIMENGANAMTTIKDGFSAITNGIPQQTSNAIATNIDRVIDAIKAQDVAVQNQPTSNMTSTAYIKPYSNSANIINTAASNYTPLSPTSEMLFGSGSGSTTNNNSGGLRFDVTGFYTPKTSSSSSSSNISATKALEKVIEIAVKWQSQLGYKDKQPALDAILNGSNLHASNSTSDFNRKYIEAWNSKKGSLSKSQRKSAINKALKGSLASQKSKYNLHTYAKGTLSALPGLAQIFEEGPEIITTSKGTFMPFSGGEGVIPADITKGLMKLGIAMENGDIENKVNTITSIVDKGFANIDAKLDDFAPTVHQAITGINDEINDAITLLYTSNNQVGLMMEQIKQSSSKNAKEEYTEIKTRFSEEIKQAIQKANELRTEMQSSEKPKAYIKTSYGELKPIESNIELFSSGGERDKMMESSLDLYKSLQGRTEEIQNSIVNNSGATNNNVTISSLITVNGNVDDATVDKIQQVASDLAKNRKFLNNIVTYVNTEQAKDLRKSGRSR